MILTIVVRFWQLKEASVLWEVWTFLLHKVFQPPIHHSKVQIFAKSNIELDFHRVTDTVVTVFCFAWYYPCSIVI